MKKFILAIDQGTTGTTALIFDKQSKKILDSVNIEFRQYFPNNSWVEHDLNEIWETVESSVSQVLKRNKITSKEIESIGITNQRETTCAFKSDGEVLHNAIVWQDRRTSNFCEENKNQYKVLKEKTGLPLDPYFSASKMRWLLQESKKVKESLNDLKFGTIDTFLLFKLTNCKSFATEPTNASRTMLMNLKTRKWDEDLLNFFGISKNNLPKIQDTFSHFGTTEGLSFLDDGIPITCLFGDQQAALFGQACYKKNQLKCTYGTGAFLLLNTENKIIHSKNGLLTTLAYQYKEEPAYALEGSTYIAGAAVQYLRDQLSIINDAKEIEDLALDASIDECEDVFLFPFFSGIGSPYWKPKAKACLYGLTRGTRKEEIARACLEGIAFSINDLIQAMEKESGEEIKAINVDGGATRNNFLLKLQSNISKKEIIRPENIESTAFGAILGSMIGNNLISIDNIKDFWKQDLSISPKFQSKKEEDYFQNKTKNWTKICNKLYL